MMLRLFSPDACYASHADTPMPLMLMPADGYAMIRCQL